LDLINPYEEGATPSFFAKFKDTKFEKLEVFEK